MSEPLFTWDDEKDKEYIYQSNSPSAIEQLDNVDWNTPFQSSQQEQLTPSQEASQENKKGFFSNVWNTAKNIISRGIRSNLHPIQTAEEDYQKIKPTAELWGEKLYNFGKEVTKKRFWVGTNDEKTQEQKQKYVEEILKGGEIQQPENSILDKKTYDVLTLSVAQEYENVNQRIAELEAQTDKGKFTVKDVGRFIAGSTPVTTPLLTGYNAKKTELDHLYKLRDIYETYLGLSESHKGLIDGIVKNWKQGEVIPFASSVNDVLELLNDKRYIKKLDKVHQEITNPNFFDRIAEADLKGRTVEKYSKSDLGENMGVGTIQSLKYMLEFLLTDGISTGVKDSVLKTLSLESAEELTGSKMKKVGTMMLENSITSGVRTATIFSPNVAKETIQRHDPEYLAVASPEGDLAIKKLDDKGKSWGKAFVEGLATTYLATFSENMGDVASEVFDPIKYGKQSIIAKFMQKLGVKSVSRITPLLEKAGWDGIVGEVFEEEFQQVFQDAIDKKEWNNPFTTPEGIDRLINETFQIGLQEQGFSAIDLLTSRKSLSPEEEKALEELRHAPLKTDPVETKKMIREWLEKNPPVAETEDGKLVDDKGNVVGVSDEVERQEALQRLKENLEKEQPKNDVKSIADLKAEDPITADEYFGVSEVNGYQLGNVKIVNDYLSDKNIKSKKVGKEVELQVPERLREVLGITDNIKVSNILDERQAKTTLAKATFVIDKYASSVYGRDFEQWLAMFDDLSKTEQEIQQIPKYQSVPQDEVLRRFFDDMQKYKIGSKIDIEKLPEGTQVALYQILEQIQDAIDNPVRRSSSYDETTGERRFFKEGINYPEFLDPALRNNVVMQKVLDAFRTGVMPRFGTNAWAGVMDILDYAGANQADTNSYNTENEPQHNLNEATQASTNIESSSANNAERQSDIEYVDPLDVDIPFRRSTVDNIRESNLNKETIDAIAKLNRKLFGDSRVKYADSILTPSGEEALGMYKDGWITINKKKGDPQDTFLHESVHKALDIMTYTTDYGVERKRAILDEIIKKVGKEELIKKWGTPEKIAKFRLDKYKLPKSVEVFHGTHARDIDKFSLDYLKTGEGAIAYGWGLYFTDDKDIANWYREKVSYKRFGPDMVEDKDKFTQYIANALTDFRKKIPTTIEEKNIKLKIEYTFRSNKKIQKGYLMSNIHLIMDSLVGNGKWEYSSDVIEIANFINKLVINNLGTIDESLYQDIIFPTIHLGYFYRDLLETGSHIAYLSSITRKAMGVFNEILNKGVYGSTSSSKVNEVAIRIYDNLIDAIITGSWLKFEKQEKVKDLIETDEDFKQKIIELEADWNDVIGNHIIEKHIQIDTKKMDRFSKDFFRKVITIENTQLTLPSAKVVDTIIDMLAQDVEDWRRTDDLGRYLFGKTMEKEGVEKALIEYLKNIDFDDLMQIILIPEIKKRVLSFGDLYKYNNQDAIHHANTIVSMLSVNMSSTDIKSLYNSIQHVLDKCFGELKSKKQWQDIINRIKKSRGSLYKLKIDPADKLLYLPRHNSGDLFPFSKFNNYKEFRFLNRYRSNLLAIYQKDLNISDNDFIALSKIFEDRKRVDNFTVEQKAHAYATAVVALGKFITEMQELARKKGEESLYDTQRILNIMQLKIEKNLESIRFDNRAKSKVMDDVFINGRNIYRFKKNLGEKDIKALSDNIVKYVNARFTSKEVKYLYEDWDASTKEKHLDKLLDSVRVYINLSEIFSRIHSSSDLSKLLSMYLLDHGWIGWRYLANESSKPTDNNIKYNYVIWDDKALDILEEIKYRRAMMDNARGINIYDLAEEELAENFIKYANDKKALKEAGFSEKFIQFLKDLWKVLKGLAGADKHVEQFYKDLYDGKFNTNPEAFWNYRHQVATLYRQRLEEERKDQPSITEDMKPDPDVNKMLDDVLEHLPVYGHLQLPELVSLANALTNGDVSLKNMKPNKLGVAITSRERAKIRLNKLLFEPILEEDVDENGKKILKPESEETRIKRLEAIRRTLAHEIGHVVDWMDDKTLKRGNILGHVAVLKNYLKNDFDEFNNGVVKEELKTLATFWNNYDTDNMTEKFMKYAYSSSELYADAISVLLNDPDTLLKLAPNFYQAFTTYLHKKPKAKKIFFDLLDSIIDEEAVMQYRQSIIKQSYQKGKEKRLEIDQEKVVEAESRKAVRFKNALETALVTEYAPIYQELKRRYEDQGVYMSKKELMRQTLEKLQSIKDRQALFVRDVEVNFIDPLVANEIDLDDVGAIIQLLRQATDRKDVANPHGLMYEDATRTMQSILAKYTPEKQQLIKDKLQWFKDKNFEVVKWAYKSGFFSEEFFSEVAEKNKNTYNPFAVVDYITNNSVYAGIIKVKGTLKGVENPIVTQLLKTIAIQKAVEWNNAKSEYLNVVYEHFMDELTAQKAEPIRDYNGRIVKWKENKKYSEKAGYKLLEIVVEGKRQGYWIDKYVADFFSRANTQWMYTGLGAGIRTILDPMRFANRIFKPAVTSYSAGFTFFSNPIRDIARSMRNIYSLLNSKDVKSRMTLQDRIHTNMIISGIDYLVQWVKALPTSWKFSIKKEGFTEQGVIRHLVENGVLSITEVANNPEYELDDMTVDSEELINPILRKVGLKTKSRSKTVNLLRKTSVGRLAINILDKYEDIMRVIDANSKIAGYQILKNRGIADDKAIFWTRNYIGTPNYREKGLFTPVTNTVFVFSNIATQGIRTDMELATNPQTRAGWWLYMVAQSVLPAVALAMGMGGWFDDDKDKVKLSELLKRMTEYDRTNYIVIPFGLFGKTNKVLYARIPMDETQRLMHAFTYKIVTPFVDKNREVGDIPREVLSLILGQSPFNIMPDQMNPLFSILYDWAEYINDHNPYDTFRGREKINPVLWEQGGATRLVEMLKLTLTETGTVKFDSYDDLYQTRGEEIIRSLPIVNRVFRVTDWGLMETQRAKDQQEFVEKQKIKAQQIKDIKNLTAKLSKNPEYDWKSGAKQIIDKYGTDTASKTRVRKNIKKDVLAVQTKDTRYQRLMDYTSNSSDDVELLREYKKSMSEQEFKEFLKTGAYYEAITSKTIKLLKDEGVIDRSTYYMLKREYERGKRLQ